SVLLEFFRILSDCWQCCLSDVFFFNATATTEIYSLSLHDALPIWAPVPWSEHWRPRSPSPRFGQSRMTAYGLTATRRVVGSSPRSEEHTSELQSRENLVCRLLLEKKNYKSSGSIF